MLWRYYTGEIRAADNHQDCDTFKAPRRNMQVNLDGWMKIEKQELCGDTMICV